jgi:hypothetical protein
MDLQASQKILLWVSLLALVVSSLAVLVFWVRFRAPAAAPVFLGMVVFVAATLLIQVFPAYSLEMNPQTGRVALVERYKTLHICLYTAMGAAAFSVAVGLWWLFCSVVPKEHRTRWQ